MPIYEYRCQHCGKRLSVFWRSLSAVNDASVTCERCGSKRVARMMSKVRVMRGSGSSDTGTGGAMDSNDDALMNEMAGLDENDPRALGRFMRKMAAESGEDLGAEFGEVVGRLEKGEDPEKIEQDMGGIFGDDPTGGMGGMGMNDDYGAPAPDTSADKAEEAKDKKVTAKKRTVAMKGKSGAKVQTASKKHSKARA